MRNSFNKKVAISAGVLAPGGAETHARIMALVLRRAGCPVTIYGTNCLWQRETMTQLKASGVQFLIPPLFVRLLPKLGALWAVLRWRLSPPTNAASLYAIGAGRSHLLLKRLAGPGVVSIFHEIGGGPPSSDSMAAECLRALDAAVACAELVARHMATFCQAKPIRVIPFLTAEQAVPPPSHRPAVGNRPLQVVYLGRLEKRKRPDRLVREWARLTAGPPLGPAILHLHGDDEGRGLMPELEAYVAANGLAASIKLHGGYLHSQLPEILSNMDVVVLPSEWEGLPLVLVEAMQRGVPFVSTATGGTAELGQDNPDVIVTGVEWEAFEAGLLEMARRLRVGQVDAVRLHRWAEPRYGFETVARQWQEALLHSRQFFGLK